MLDVVLCVVLCAVLCAVPVDVLSVRNDDVVIVVVVLVLLSAEPDIVILSLDIVIPNFVGGWARVDAEP